MQDFPEQGPIADIFFPRLIARLHGEGFEGTVRVSLHDTTKVIYFKKGEIISAASNAESDRLANLLIRDGRLTQAQVEMAQSRLQAGGSLGKTLIEMGFLTPTELLQGARRQVREILASCFALSTGGYQIVPGPLPSEVTSLGLASKRLLFDCLMQARDRRWIIREMRSMESVYKPTEALVPGLNELKLDIEVDRVGRMLDGTLSLRDLSSRTSLDDFTVGKVVLAFDLLGMSERVGAPMEAESEADAGRTIVIESDAPQAEPEAALQVGAGEGEPPLAQEEIPAEAPPETRMPAAAPQVPLAAVSGTSPPLRIAVALDEPAPEPPPIPKAELPAFALPAGEAPVEVEWLVDPETGERVHVGPIEVTFDGRFVTRDRESRLPLRLLAIAGAVSIALASGVYLLAVRRGGEPVAEEHAPALRAAPPQETESVPQPEPQAELPAEPAPIAAAQGTSPSLRDDPRYLAALGRLDAGDLPGASRIFEELIAAQSGATHTLQLMIACQDATLRNAVALSGNGGSLFFLPYSLKGRDCYRACWGVYGSKDVALAAAASLPPALAEGGIQPIVISLPHPERTGQS